ncbi:hypothetical protein GF337_08715, partial [candidate division KSB1 bacterium]|nr:hypothetical protein [candidate division KSB1 bacterium]
MIIDKKSPVFKIILIFIVLIWIPTLSYTIYQLTRIDKTETMIREIYDHQLNGIIFSINQYVWDVAGNWAKNIRTFYLQNLNNDRALRISMEEFVSNNDALNGVFLYNKQSGKLIDLNFSATPISKSNLIRLIETNDEIVDQLFEQVAKGYDRIIPFPETGNNEASDLTLLIFAIYLPGVDIGNRVLGGVFVNTSFAGREIIGRKFDEIETEDFMFGLRNTRTSELIYTTSPQVSWDTFERQGSLWLFPELNMLIRLRGTTTEKIAHTRTRINVWSLIAVNIALLGGILMVLRSVFREMQLSKMKSDFV